MSAPISLELFESADQTAGQAATTAAAPHHWKFFRAGGFDQVRLDSADDLFALAELDPKLWVALSCPTASIDFPAETLTLLDADGDGHIRAPDLLAAIDWCRERLADRNVLLHPPGRLPLAALDSGSTAGQRLRRSAEQILRNLGRPDDDAIGLADLGDPAMLFKETRFNGDGVITERSADTPELAEAIRLVGVSFGTRLDRSGESGIDTEAIRAHFALARRFLAWQNARPAEAGQLDLETAANAWRGVHAKIDDYFTRCRMAAYDPRAREFMNGLDGEYAAVGRAVLAGHPETLAALPLARVEAERALPLGDGANPAWLTRLADFERHIVQPVLGARTALSAADWAALKERFGPLSDWIDAQPAKPASPAWPIVESWLADDVETRLLALVAQDVAASDEAAGIDEVRKLLLFVRDLASFANNFVSFRDFYTRQGRAVFQCGTLYLDGRSCELVIPVDDVAAHGALAALARLYLVYCTCHRAGETRQIVAAMTDGDADQLMAGRNGVFVDRQGRDWDARVVRLVEHPISLREAFWAPYRRIGRMAAEQLQKLAASRAQANELKAAQTAVDSVAGKTGAATPVAAPPAPFDVAKFAGIFAAIGLAVGAIGTAFAAAVTGFLGLKAWQMPLAIAGLLLVVSGPSLLIAWFKLRGRTLGPLLDANGWAINARAVINRPFGRALTQVAHLPAGAERSLRDPYAEKKTPWGLYAGLLLALVVGLWLLVRAAAGMG